MVSIQVGVAKTYFHEIGHDVQEDIEEEKPSFSTFVLDGQKVIFQPDSSAIWDDGNQRYENELHMLNAWTRWLDEALTEPEMQELAEGVIRVVITENSLEASGCVCCA